MKIKRVWQQTLLVIQRNPSVSSPAEGEEFICHMCEMPEKPCLENPLISCPERLLGGTQLEAVRDRSRSVDRNEIPRCLKCGRPLSERRLKSEPLSELCSLCGGVVRRFKRSTLH